MALPLDPFHTPSSEPTTTALHQTLSTLQQDIARLEASLRLLRKQERATQQRLSAAKPSPIHTLPPELVLCIFGHVVEGVRWPVVQGDLALGQVCSYWRNLFIGFPRLWSKVDLELGVRPEDEEEAFIDMCLTRSASDLIDLSVKTRLRDGADIQSQIFERQISLLVSSSRRWRTADLDLEGVALDTLQSLRGNVPHLEELRVRGRTFKSPCDVFLDAPRLRKVSLESVSHPVETIPLPWEQFTHLSTWGSVFREGEYSTMLTRASATLISLSSGDERILEVTGTNVTSTIHLPRLRTLHISNKTAHAAKLVRMLTTPLLTSLSIMARTPITNAMTSDLSKLFYRSTNTLCHLSLHAPRDPMDSFTAWEQTLSVSSLLEECKFLEDLELRMPGVASEVMPRLTRIASSAAEDLRQQGAASTSSASVSAAFTPTIPPPSVSQIDWGTWPFSAPINTAPPSVETILPFLRNLVLEDTRCTQDSLVGLTEMVRSRVAEGGLVKASVDVRFEPEDADVLPIGPCHPTWNNERDWRGYDGVGLQGVEIIVTRPRLPDYPELNDLLRDLRIA